MKSFKLPVFTALIFLASIGHADITYKWTSLNEKQIKSFQDNCLSQTHQQLIKGGLSAVVAVIAGAGTIMKSDAMGPDAIGVAATVVGMGSTVATVAVDLLSAHLSDNEIKALVIEQQTGLTGLVTVAAEQIAKENNFDINQMLAVLNAAALNEKICIEADSVTSLGAPSN